MCVGAWGVSAVPLLDPERSLREGLTRAAAAIGVELADVPLTYPPQAELGDLASPVSFELARVLRKPPAAIAASLVAAFEPGSGIARVDSAGGGTVP